MNYKMRAEVVLYPGPSPWHFIYIPKQKSQEFRKKYAHKQRGWSSLRVTIEIGKTKWNTSIFYDKRSESFLLPVKADVRKKEGIIHGDKVNFSLEIL